MSRHVAPAILQSDLAVLPLDEIALQANEFRRASRATNTLTAYRSAVAGFKRWADQAGYCAFPASADTVIAYLIHKTKEGSKPSTLAVILAAIRHLHREAGSASPTEDERVKAVVRGIRRTVGTAPKQKQPATAERMSAMLAHVPDTLAGKRDRALVLLGMAGAFRRSELVALDFEDIEFSDAGADVRVRRSKTDQEGQGCVVAIPHGVSLKPIAALAEWIAAAGISTGPLFRAVAKGGRISDRRLSCRSVANIVKDYAGRAGLPSDAYSGHSLRAGFVTSAAERGADINRIMDQTRHVDPRTVRKYIRRAERYKDHAGAGFL